MILLDTHVLIWLDQGNEKLGKQAVKLINSAFESDALAVSAITWWEIAMLRDKKRIKLPSLQTWYQELLDSGLLEIPVDGATGITAVKLNLPHGDPADRMISATAYLTDATLITADENILTWDSSLKRYDARH